MPKLYNKQSGALLGNVTEADIQSLIDQLEEENRTDDDYYIDTATIDLLEEHGASPSLVNLLRQAVGDAEGIDIKYEK